MSYLKKSKTITEGTWFAVPLREKQYAIGIVARRDTRNSSPIMFGYFFGPSRENIPNVDELKDLSPSQAIMMARFGYLGLVEERWPIIGKDDNWNREEWSMPPFARRPILGEVSFAITYDDHNPAKSLASRRVSEEEAKQLPAEGSGGAEWIQARLLKLLND